MKKFTIWMLALVCAGAMLACSDDDDNSVKVPTAVRAAFDKMYPSATGVKWKSRKPYVMADFRDGSNVREAWFDVVGKWYMTKTEMTYAALPQAVRTAFEASAYASWKVEDVDQLVRNEMETIYAIDVKSGSFEYDLYYTADGVLLRKVADAGGDDEYEGMLPMDLPQSVKSFIQQKYAGARILAAEREGGEIEVLIVDGRTPREVYFDGTDAWDRTKTEVTEAQVPQVVMQAVRTSQYGTWNIDKIDLFENPEREWYRFELDDPQSDREVELDVLPDGTIL